MFNQAQTTFLPTSESPPVTEPSDYWNQQANLLREAGGYYESEYIKAYEEKELLDHIDRAEWKGGEGAKDGLKRRVQHYGYRYDYDIHVRQVGKPIGDLPEWVKPLADRVGKEFFDGQLPDQLIVNEYEPGQGIAPHVDRETCFGPVVVSISLASDCVMNFKRRDDRIADGDERGDKFELLLRRRSIIVLKGKSRYDWKHGIPPRQKDVVDGEKLYRTRRVSLTFRTVEQ